MKYTLLQMVKSIMSDMDSDEIEAITDTAESEQVASTIKDVYYQIIETYGIPEHYDLTEPTVPSAWVTPTAYIINDVVLQSNRLYQCLIAHTSGTFATDLAAGKWVIVPRTYLRMPAGLEDLQWIKYNKIPTGGTNDLFVDVKYLAPKAFADLSLTRASGASDTDVVDGVQGGQLILLNNVAPTYWTSFDDFWIIFDSYDNVVDTNRILESKTVIFAKLEPVTWQDDTDAFIPDLDDNLFPLLLSEAKSLCFVNLKQQGNPKLEQMARLQKVGQQNKRHRTGDQNKSVYPNYGRK